MDFRRPRKPDIQFILWALVVFRGLRLGRRAVIDSVHRGFFVGCGFLRSAECGFLRSAVGAWYPFFCGSRLGQDSRLFADSGWIGIPAMGELS